MAETRLPFPFEYQELEPEEKKEVEKFMKSINADYVRVGPKGCVVPRGYHRDAQNIYNMLLRPDDIFVTSYQRSGKAGGWRDYFDVEMTQQAERWMADNLRDTDLRFPHLDKQ